VITSCASGLTHPQRAGQRCPPTIAIVGGEVRACLDQLDAATVPAVILTGGSSQLPALRDEIRDAAGDRAVHIDPHAAAHGAAALGAAALGAAEINPHLGYADAANGFFGQPAPRAGAATGDPPRHPNTSSSWCALHHDPTGLPRLSAPPGGPRMTTSPR
jgi:hypothetical protein